MVPRVGFPMVMVMEIGILMLPAETRAAIAKLPYAVIGKMGDANEEINAVSIMMGMSVESRFVLIGRKDAVPVATVANLTTLELMPRIRILCLMVKA